MNSIKTTSGLNVSSKSIKELYDSYLNYTKNYQIINTNDGLKQNILTLDPIQKTIFNELTKHILGKETKNIGELLKLMNQCVVNRTRNKKTTVTNESEKINGFFNEYAAYLFNL